MGEATAMAEGKSAGKLGKIALKELTQSPGRYLLSPNDDSFERRQARLARAAASQKRRSLAFGDAAGEDAGAGALDKSQVLELLNNCIKLAAENKINQQNTWDLKLIDYLPDIVKADNDEDTQTNFQKASCTLEASAKIYSCRVDSVHTETYKVLGGLHRSAAPEKETNDENGEERNEQETRRKDSHKKVDTLESFESLNIKHFDASLNIDPLFSQTSAQFDEGGAKGLLLNTLSVYRGCEVLFDSNDIPEKCMKVDLPKDPPLIDLSFASDMIEQICSDRDAEISPCLVDILELLDDPFRKAAQAEQKTYEDTSWIENFTDAGDCDMGEVLDADDYVQADGPAEYFQDDGYDSPSESTSPLHQNDNEADIANGSACHDGAFPEDTIDWLREGMGIPRKNCWAGAEYWKFVRPKGEQASDNKSSKETKKKRKEQFSIQYTTIPEFDSSLFAKPRDLRANLLPQARQSVSTTLPEDLRYQAEDLLRLFLRPSVLCVRGRLKTVGSEKAKASPFTAWNDEDDDGITPQADDWDEGEIIDNVDDLIAQPRKVKKIYVNYDKTSKEVDVRALKETLWERIQDPSPDTLGESEEQGIHFSDLLGRIPENCPAAAAEDLSVHLCFICLLHLANEHNLVITDCDSMNELLILQAK